MSAKTTTEYFCDRCSTNLGDKKPAEKLTVKANLEGEWAMEFAHDWKHFCQSCRLEVIGFFAPRRSS